MVTLPRGRPIGGPDQLAISTIVETREEGIGVREGAAHELRGGGAAEDIEIREEVGKGNMPLMCLS